jgi:hypoxanthine-DNA glycosylase
MAKKEQIKIGHSPVIKTAFPPIVDKHCTLLILGTMPGERSIQLQQYYGHKSNQFWKIMFALFDLEVSGDYEKRRQLLLDHHIALWDVLSHCEGKGSADHHIVNEVVNDFASFYKKYPRLMTIVFDSTHAEKFYMKHVGKSEDKTYLRVPSPSSAHAGKSLQQKISEWKVIVPLIGNTQ